MRTVRTQKSPHYRTTAKWSSSDGRGRPLIESFRRRGIQLETRPNGRLAARPASRLTDDDRTILRSRKLEILSALTLADDDAKAGSEPSADRRNLKTLVLAGLDGNQRPGRECEVAQWCEQHRIDANIGAAILAIEANALALGWSPQRLWGFRFWPIQERGLVALLDAGDRLTLHPDHIEITKADGSTQRFWLHDS